MVDNPSIVGHRHFGGVTQFCSECKRVRKLYGKINRFDGSYGGDIIGYWILSPSLISSCSRHKWSDS